MSALIQEINYIQTTEEEYNQIASVKILVDEVYAKGIFFQLPLKTLELIRRFNTLFNSVVKEEEQNPSLVNQLVINSQYLEQQLIQEL
ncbi:hypothetical protein RM545_14660 [Zunongwangia sp. F260]|uniref:Uncharacterized protein n=1 Tax=Autumnicola lenta TaxID=3075593 RepID=A0ABU3CNX3_9FLAO|nr:hypothetical protein [Zunongwangia sp. F260]MDT0647937.1 hypothetical protein [Zunongwangia sp. F260]